MIYIDKYAYCSHLAGVHPLEKLIFGISTMGICLAANSTLVSVSILLLMAFICIKSGVSVSAYTKLMLIPFWFLAIGVITIAFTVVPNNSDMLFGLRFNGAVVGFTYYSIITAARVLFKAFGAVSCLYFISLTTPMIEIISTLRKLRLPGLFIELMGLIYRFIFVLLDTAGRIYTSQDSRLGYRSLKIGYNSMGKLVSALFIRSYKRADDLYIALDARGYDGELRVLERQYSFSKLNLLLIASINVMLIALAIFVGGAF